MYINIINQINNDTEQVKYKIDTINQLFNDIVQRCNEYNIYCSALTCDPLYSTASGQHSISLLNVEEVQEKLDVLTNFYVMKKMIDSWIVAYSDPCDLGRIHRVWQNGLTYHIDRLENYMLINDFSGFTSHVNQMFVQAEKHVKSLDDLHITTYDNSIKKKESYDRSKEELAFLNKQFTFPNENHEMAMWVIGALLFWIGGPVTYANTTSCESCWGVAIGGNIIQVILVMGFYFLYRKRAIAKLISEKEIASFSEFSEYNRLDEAQKQYAAHIVSLREGLGLKEVRVRVTKNRIRYYYDIDDMMKDQANQRAIVNPDLVYKYEDDMIDIQEGDLELINEYFDEELIKQIITEAKSEGKSRILCPICKSTVKSKNFLKHYRKTHENMNERVDFVPF